MLDNSNTKFVFKNAESYSWGGGTLGRSTGLPDNIVYWPDPMVQYVSLTKLTYVRGQFSCHSPVGGLTMTTPMARSDFLQYPA